VFCIRSATMSPSILGLPPVSPELKSIVPYLQRADELQVQDPIMAYWCTFGLLQTFVLS
jgi:vacuolar protein sorting-associated protein VTA1